MRARACVCVCFLDDKLSTVFGDKLTSVFRSFFSMVFPANVLYAYMPLLCSLEIFSPMNNVFTFINGQRTHACTHARARTHTHTHTHTERKDKTSRVYILL